MNDQRIEIARIGHGAAHDARIAQGARSIAESDCACLLKQPDFGNLLALQPLGQGRRGQKPHPARVAGAPQQKIDNRRFIDGRIGIRQDENRGDTAGRRRRRRRRDRLAMLGARLADKGAHVDQAWSNHIAAAIENIRMRRQGTGHDTWPKILNHTIENENPALRLRLLVRIDEARIHERNGLMRDRRGRQRVHDGSKRLEGNLSPVR
jgi:hypothetical protein